MKDHSTGRVWPNFLVIGTAKAGTTALYNQLKQHPDVFMSAVKEPGFFAHEGGGLTYRGPGDESARSRTATTVDEYLAHFDPVSGEAAIGEASVVYLYDPEAPRRIRLHIPEVRLIAILRDPVERAFSNYLDNLRHGFETASFDQALALESQRQREGWSWYWRYRDIGFYGRQLQRYSDLFDRRQLKIFFYDDYEANPADVIRQAFEFLGVDEAFKPDLNARYNVSRLGRSDAFDTLVTQQNPIKSALKRVTTARFRHRIAHSRTFQRMTKHRPSLPSRVAAELREVYADDIRLLERITGADLRRWLDD